MLLHSANVLATVTISGFDNVSPEVTGLILDACDIRVLKKLRLANHAFHDLVTPLIFQDVWLGMFDYSLINLEMISLSERLAPIVKRIIFCGAWMRRLSYRHWRKYIDVPGLRAYQEAGVFLFEERDARIRRKAKHFKTLRRSDLSEEDLHSHWNQYRSLAMEQRKWANAEIARNRLNQALKLLTSLQNITISKYPDGTLPEPLWLNLWSRTLLLMTWYPSYHGQENFVATLNVLECFELSRRAPSLPALDIYMPSALLQRYFHGNWRRSRWRQVTVNTPFRRLRSLLLHVDLDSNEKWSIKSGARGLVRWLKSATQLTKLDLQVTDDQTYWIRYFGKARLPRLKDLKLCIEAPYGLFVEFLRRHSKTMENLHIYGCTIYDGTWPSLLSDLPQLLPHLRKITVRGPLSSMPQKVIYRKRYDFNWMIMQPSWLRQFQLFVLRGVDCPEMDPEKYFQDHKDECADDPLVQALEILDKRIKDRNLTGKSLSLESDVVEAVEVDESTDSEDSDPNFSEEAPSDYSSDEYDWTSDT